MLRLKLILVVTLALTALAFAVTQLLEGLRDAERERLEASVVRADRAFAAHHRNVQLDLFALATELARSDVAAWIGAIQDHESALLSLEGEVYRAVPGGVTDEKKAAERAAWLTRHRGELLDRIANDVADRLERFGGLAIWKERTRLEVVAEAKKMLVLCNAVGVNNCEFRFGHYPLRERVLALRQSPRPGGVSPDVVFLIDDTGRGVADADVGKWSDVRDFADRVPAVIEALATGSAVRDLGRLPNRQGWFLLAVAPIVEGAVRRGAVLVATPLDGDRLRRDKDLVGFDVGWFVDGDLALTTLDKDQAVELASELGAARDADPHALVVGKTFVTSLAPVMGNVSMRDVRLAVIARQDPHAQAIDAAIGWTWTFALVFGLLGAAAVGLILRRFFLPLRLIDARLHEIIQGNREVEIPTDHADPTWRTLGQALNAAHAVLAQRDEAPVTEPAESWAARMLVDGQAAPGP